MPEIRLTLLVGSYALTHVLGRGAMTEHVRDFRARLPRYFPLPHPSWRTTAWERRNPWFGRETCCRHCDGRRRRARRLKSTAGRDAARRQQGQRRGRGRACASRNTRAHISP